MITPSMIAIIVPLNCRRVTTSFTMTSASTRSLNMRTSSRPARLRSVLNASDPSPRTINATNHQSGLGKR